MIIKVYSPIGQGTMPDGQALLSAEYVKDMLGKHPSEKVVCLDINSPGGDCEEAFAIYDLLRSSGREIHSHIDGGCHSASIILLLAAAKQNRTASPNSRSIIHDVRGVADEVTAGSAVALGERLMSYRNQMLDIYAERTGTDRAKLESVLLEEKARTAQELLDLGFISKITQYTNYKSINQQKQIMSKANKLQELGMAIANFFKEQVTNYAFLDADGNTLFETEKEDDSLEVGDPATPDGTFDLPDGRTVTIADGVVTDISEPQTAEELQEQVDNLTQRLETAENLLREAQSTITNLAKVQSTYQAKGRIVNPGKPANGAMTSEERKAIVKNNLKVGKK